MRLVRAIALLAAVLAALAACSRPKAPEIPGLPGEIPVNPQLPSLDKLPDILKDLGLPDLSNIPNLPQIGDLPGLSVGENAIAFAGPTEQRIGVGERIPGTDIELTAIGDEGAEFHISGLRSLRTIGDSLDFDGAWSGLGGVSYTLRLRIYRVGDDYVRAAGVQRLVVENIQPQEQAVSLGDGALKIPYTGSAAAGATLKGTTLGYGGSGDRGAEITGLPEGDFPFRKTGDSIRWQGLLRPDLPIAYSLRVVHYNENSLQVAGIATIQLPGP